MRWTVALALGLVPATASADQTGVEARQAWQACFPAGSPAPVVPDLGDADIADSGSSARKTDDGYRIELEDSGSGAEAVYWWQTILFSSRLCRAAWAEGLSFDGAFARWIDIGWIHQAAPDGALLRELAAEPARPDAPEHALGRAWLQHACEGGPESTLAFDRPIEGPIAPAQPWHPGRPRQPVDAFWSTEALARLPASAWTTERGEYEPPAPPMLGGIVVPGAGAPRRTFRAAGVELFESEVPGRNTARAIAIRDPRRNRHRWVVITRGCVQGSTVSWLGAAGKRIVGVTRSGHSRYAAGDAILLIDVPTGTAWAMRIPEPIRVALRADDWGDPEMHATLSRRGVVTLRVGRTRAAIDVTRRLPPPRTGTTRRRDRRSRRACTRSRPAGPTTRTERSRAPRRRLHRR